MVRFHLPILVAIVKVKTIQIGAHGIDGGRDCNSAAPELRNFSPGDSGLPGEATWGSVLLAPQPMKSEIKHNEKK
ncbi:hypothetical protein SODG_002220 [Sodalis praecaptivus]